MKVFTQKKNKIYKKKIFILLYFNNIKKMTNLFANLSRNQLIGIAVGSVLLIGLIIALTRSKQSYEDEEQACKWLNGNDVVYYKLDGNDLTYTIRKINYQQLESYINQINTDLEECKLLQFTGFMNQYYDKPRFRMNIRAIKTRYNRISTLCKDEKEVLKTNPNAKLVPQAASTFLNILDKYLNTILYPYIVKIKLDDNDTANDIYTEPVPETFKQFYEKETSKVYQTNYLTQAVTNPELSKQETKPAEKQETKPADQKKEDSVKEETKPADQKKEETVREETKPVKPAEEEKEKIEKQIKNVEQGGNFNIYIMIALIILVLVVIFKK